MAGFNNYYGMNSNGVPNGVPNAIPNYVVSPYYNSNVPQNMGYQQATLPLVYVHGREGANAYQLPQGVTKQLLWDDEMNRFYIKALDEYGRPKIVADNDFFPHVEEPKSSPQPSDLSDYPTRKDLEDFLSKFDTSRYLTREDLAEELSHLCLGAQGRIVRDEHDA